MAREKALKGGQGRAHIWKIIEEKGLISACPACRRSFSGGAGGRRFVPIAIGSPS